MTMLEQEFRLREEARSDNGVMTPPGRRRGSRAGTWIAVLLIVLLLAGLLVASFATGGDAPPDPGGNTSIPATTQPASPNG